MDRTLWYNQRNVMKAMGLAENASDADSSYLFEVGAFLLGGVRMRRQDILYYNLYQAIGVGVCPICHWVNHFVHNYFDNILYEMVNDFKLRQQLNRSRGFCREHALELMSMGDPLGHAIIYAGLVDHLIDELGHSIAIRAHPAKHRDEVKRSNCPACMKAQETEDRYIAGFLESLVEEEFRSKYEQSPGLCIPHFQKCISTCGHREIARFIHDTQLASMQKISAELKEIARKSDYRFANEPAGAEKDAWIRAVYLLVGDRRVGDKAKR